MIMKKLFDNLPFRLLLGIIIGVILGQVFPESVMKVVVTLQYIMGQLITFCVPLIIIGFIAPSITKLGKNASRLLGVAIVIAYVSSVCAALMSTGAGYALIPHLSIDTEVAGLRTLPDVVFELNIPQIMSVMSALVLSVLIGLAATWTNSKLTCDFLGEFQNIVLDIVGKIIIPMLPFYIAATFCNLSYEGMITHQLPAFIQIILIVMAGHYIWLAVLYLLAGAYSGKNPWEVLRHYGPAYLTAVGTMSSAATLAVALDCARKSKVLRKDMVSFGIPLFANIHLCGSVLTLRPPAQHRHHAPLLRPARHLRHRRSRRPWRHRHGFSGPHHRRSDVRWRRHRSDARHLRPAGQLRHRLQRHRRRRSDPDADRLRREARHQEQRQHPEPHPVKTASKDLSAFL